MNTPGFSGSIVVNTTTPVSGVFSACQVLSDAVFATYTDTTMHANDDTTAITGAALGTVPAGTILYGTITAVTLTSGTVVLYK